MFEFPRGEGRTQAETARWDSDFREHKICQTGRAERPGLEGREQSTAQRHVLMSVSHLVHWETPARPLVPPPPRPPRPPHPVPEQLSPSPLTSALDSLPSLTSVTAFFMKQIDSVLSLLKTPWLLEHASRRHDLGALWARGRLPGVTPPSPPLAATTFSHTVLSGEAMRPIVRLKKAR